MGIQRQRRHPVLEGKHHPLGVAPGEHHANRRIGCAQGNGREVEGGHHAEVAATATADGPEQVGVLAGVQPEQPTIGRHHLGTGHAVKCEPVLPGERADATALSQTGDAHRRATATRDGHAPLRQHAVRTQQVGARADARPRASGVHGHLVQTGHVDDQPAAGGIALKRVAARSGDWVQAQIAGEVDGHLHVVGSGGLHHRLRVPVVIDGVPRQTRRGVRRAGWQHQCAVQLRRQIGVVEGRGAAGRLSGVPGQVRNGARAQQPGTCHTSAAQQLPASDAVRHDRREWRPAAPRVP